MRFKQRILNHFDIEPGFYQGPAFKKLFSNIYDSMKGDEFITLIGGPGCGKKTVVNSVWQQIEKENELGNRKHHHIVYIHAQDKQKIRINQIINAMIYDLSSENPTRDPELKARHLARILGNITHTRKEKVTVIIEQAHQLHGNTIRALKELRELKFLGNLDMFGIVLIGHKPLKDKIERLDDVVLRVEMEEMTEATGWMNYDERLDYLKARFGALLTGKMREQIALAYKTPLSMDRLIYEKMKEVYERGDNAFKEADFMLDLRTIVQSCNLSYQIIADATPNKVSKTAVGLVINGKYDNQAVIDEVTQTIAELTGKTQKLQKTG